MQRIIRKAMAVLAIGAIGIAGCKKEKTSTAQSVPAPATAMQVGTELTGERLFKQFCAACHPDGGNVINPKKTLHAAVLADYQINKEEDMIRLMRNPGPGMRKFDQATISDEDARMIHDYVVTTFR